MNRISCHLLALLLRSDICQEARFKLQLALPRVHTHSLIVVQRPDLEVAAGGSSEDPAAGAAEERQNL